ncbi:uncharacterized protein SCODWIG_01738 [Saccharomycodes ludwigii]|uniref:LisH domain-containing protein n=1 Tax=Saccharomycodes ludwigii TaxID=36035 RepID=A0A376B5L0_9ASCO|nr:uncharacterized protein SCODWIG_01738 [Saccharomycodes ludwigii]
MNLISSNTDLDKEQIVKLLISTLDEFGYSQSSSKLRQEAGLSYIEPILAYTNDFFTILKNNDFEKINLLLLSKLPFNGDAEFIRNNVDSLDFKDYEPPDTSKITNANTKFHTWLSILLYDLSYIQSHGNVASNNATFFSVTTTKILDLYIIVQTHFYFCLLLDNDGRDLSLILLRKSLFKYLELVESNSRYNNTSLLTKKFNLLEVLPLSITMDSYNINTSLKKNTHNSNDFSIFADKNFIIQLIKNSFISYDVLPPNGRLLYLLEKGLESSSNSSNNSGDCSSIIGVPFYNSTLNMIPFIPRFKLLLEIPVLNNNDSFVIKFSNNGKMLALGVNTDENGDYRKVAIYDVDNILNNATLRCYLSVEQSLLFKANNNNNSNSSTKKFNIVNLQFSSNDDKLVTCSISGDVNVYDLAIIHDSIGDDNKNQFTNNAFENIDYNCEETTAILYPILTFAVNDPCGISRTTKLSEKNDNYNHLHKYTRKSLYIKSLIITHISKRSFSCDWIGKKEQRYIVLGSPDRGITIIDTLTKTTCSCQIGSTKNKSFPFVVDDLKVFKDKYLLVCSRDGKVNSVVDVFQIIKEPRITTNSVTTSTASTNTKARFLLLHVHSIDILGKVTSLELPKISTNTFKTNNNIDTLMLLTLDGNELQLWDWKESILRQKYYGSIHEKVIIKGCFIGTKNQYISCGSQDGKIYIWNTNMGNLVAVLNSEDTSLLLNQHVCNMVTVNPINPNIFASCGDTGYVSIWEVM